MRFPKFAKSLAAILVIGVAAPAIGGCAVAEGDAPGETVGSTTQALDVPPITMVSGGFGVLSGLITAYNTIDSLVKYGTTNPAAAAVDMLKQQNVALENLRASQDAQFAQLTIDETRSLGSRQYLVVASYQDKKFLLGVCPGRIDLLSALPEKSAEEKPTTYRP